jgi:hypothetical protein
MKITKKLLLSLIFLIICNITYAQLNKEICEEIFIDTDAQNSKIEVTISGLTYTFKIKTEREIIFKDKYLLIKAEKGGTIYMPYDKIKSIAGGTNSVIRIYI